MEPTLRVALYARVSSQRQADEMTVASQMAALRQRIHQDGLTIEDELCFVDEGYSGAILVRPALERLRDIAWAGGLDRLYVHSPDRLARKYAYQVVLLEELRKHGVEVVFLNHDPQDQSPEGDLLLQVQGMIAEYERTKILERTRRGRRYAARQGKVSAIAHAPYGYRYVSKQEGEGEARWDIVLEQARVVKAIFAWVALEGLSLSDVARRLAEGGVPSATGKPRWDRATVRGILTHQAYTGNAKYPKTKLFPRPNGGRSKRGDPTTPRRDKTPRPAAPEEQDTIHVPALVSEELFAAAAERLEENRRRHREQKQGAEFLLSGLLVCGRCGSAYCGRRHRSRDGQGEYIYYRCLGTDKYRHGGDVLCTNASVNGVRLEDEVWSDACALLQDPGRLRREFERRLEHPPEERFDTAHQIQAVAQLKRRIARLIDAYENGFLDKDEFQPRITAAKERLAREEAVLAEHERDATRNEDLRLLIGQFETFAAEISAGLNQADFATRRKLLRLLVHRIEVTEDEVRLIYKVQPHPFVLRPARGVLQDCLKFDNTAQGRAAHPESDGRRKTTNPERV